MIDLYQRSRVERDSLAGLDGDQRADGDDGVPLPDRVPAVQSAHERDKGGPFADLFDLVARVGARVLNRRLLEALIKKPVRRIVVASSMSIYGEGLYVTAAGERLGVYAFLKARRERLGHRARPQVASRSLEEVSVQNTDHSNSIAPVAMLQGKLAATVPIPSRRRWFR